MSDDGDRPAFERPLEAFVFAPLGFVLEARQMYPRFVDRGRNQILLARLVGRYATRQAMTTAGEVLERNAGPATDLLRVVGLVPPSEPAPSAPDQAPAAPGPADAPGDGPIAGAGDVAGDVPGGDGGAAPEVVVPEVEVPEVEVPEVGSLAIPDYDSLAASQVVPRLDSLTADELEAVRCYETGVRGRKTILSKIAQLQAG